VIRDRNLQGLPIIAGLTFLRQLQLNYLRKVNHEVMHGSQVEYEP
ncbi:MAG: hypothetical protein ACI9CQ_004665, partial [Saprospiraceae bacterium]